MTIISEITIFSFDFDTLLSSWDDLVSFYQIQTCTKKSLWTVCEKKLTLTIESKKMIFNYLMTEKIQTDSEFHVFMKKYILMNFQYIDNFRSIEEGCFVKGAFATPN